MKELDFLPQSYRDAALRRTQNKRNALLTAGLLLAMACLHGLNMTRIQTAEAALTALRNGEGGWQSAKARAATLQAQKAQAQKRLELISRLEDAAPLDAAIGEVTRLLSESMAMRSLRVETSEPAAMPPHPAVPAATGSQGAQPAPAGTRACMTGIAANDVEVGIFLGKLSSCPLFSDVSLSFSRDMRGAGRRMREFEVKFTIRPVETAP